MAKKAKPRKPDGDYVVRWILKVIDKISVWHYYWSKKVFILIVILLSGCVSHRTLRIEKYESYTAGMKSMADLCLRSLDEVGNDLDGIEEIKRDLRFVLGK